MYIIVLITLLAAGTAFAQFDEEGATAIHKVFCDEEFAYIKPEIMECFEGMEFEAEHKEIIVGCCEGLEDIVTEEAVISWVCAHKPEEIIQSAVCYLKKLEETGNKKKYFEAIQPVKECFCKPEEEK